MSKFTFTSHVTAHAKAETKTRSLLAKASDAMIADRITVTMFSKKTDGSDRAEDFRTDLKAAILAAFPPAWQKTYRAPIKSLADGNEPGQKGDAKYPAPGTRRYVQQQIGARVNDYKRGLERRLNGPANKGADQKRTSDRTFCEERLIAMEKRIEKSENAKFDVVAFKEKLREARKILNTNV